MRSLCDMRVRGRGVAGVRFGGDCWGARGVLCGSCCRVPGGGSVVGEVGGRFWLDGERGVGWGTGWEIVQG